jgi:hypothetical protein
MQAILAIWNGGLMDLSKSYKIDCIKKINGLILRFILARCDEDSRFHWNELFEEFEHLLVTMVEKNPEGRRHLQFVMDREILSIVNKINNIQNREEKHHQYLEQRKYRKPMHANGVREKHKKKKYKDCDSSSSSSESECD